MSIKSTKYSMLRISYHFEIAKLCISIMLKKLPKKLLYLYLTVKQLFYLRSVCRCNTTP